MYIFILQLYKGNALKLWHKHSEKLTNYACWWISVTPSRGSGTSDHTLSLWKCLCAFPIFRSPNTYFFGHWNINCTNYAKLCANSHELVWNLTDYYCLHRRWITTVPPLLNDHLGTQVRWSDDRGGRMIGDSVVGPPTPLKIKINST